MSTLNTLIKARALIANPENWCKDFLSVGVARCAMGAVLKASGINHTCFLYFRDVYEKVKEPTLALHEALPINAKDRPMTATDEYYTPRPWHEVAHFNNTSSHSEVLEVFDRAIKRQQLIEEMGMVDLQRELVEA